MIDQHPGRGAAWLARLTGGQEVGGSNPLAPIGETIFQQRLTSQLGVGLFFCDTFSSDLCKTAFM